MSRPDVRVCAVRHDRDGRWGRPAAQGVLVDSTGFRYSSTNSLPPICIGADDVRRCAQIRSGGSDDLTWSMVVVAGVVVFVLVAGCIVLCAVDAPVAVAYGTCAATVGASGVVWAAEEDADAAGASGVAGAAAAQGAGSGGSAGLEAEIRALPAGNSQGLVTVSTPEELQAIYDRYALGVPRSPIRIREERCESWRAAPRLESATH